MTVDSVGGVWRYALDLAGALRQRDVEIELLGLGPSPSRAQLAEVEAAKLKLYWEDLPLEWMPGGAQALARTHEAILRAATRCNADVLHLNALAIAPARAQAPPIVAVAHSCLPTWWRAVRPEPAPCDVSVNERANRAGLSAASLVVTPSHAHAAAIGAVYGTLRHLRVVYNSSAAPASPGPRREPFVFAAGRWWDEGKNARTLDEAARRLDFPLVMAGGLVDPGGRIQQIRHARALGPIDAAATAEWMRRASIFAAPSRYEPFGLAVLEAARAATPLVLSDIPTFRELWDGAALFAPPDDAEAFARAISALMEDRPMRQRIGARARVRAGRFTPDSQTEAMLAAYSDAAAMERAPSHLQKAM
jgi:glycosyltransferase involved in cell wall biosynthesis